MQFLYPLGLLSLASLVIPIVIHLWQINKGKTLKIGSISLLGETAASSSKSLQITDWPLFLLRCFFFVLVCLLLANPVINNITSAKKNKGWILVQPDKLKQVNQSYQKTIDSLLKQGFEIHQFAAGFRKMELKDTLASFDSLKQKNYNYTSLLKQVSDKLPNQYPVWVFADKNAEQFDKTLPILHIDVNWRTLKTENQPQQYTQLLGNTYEILRDKSTTTYQKQSNNKIPALNVVISAPQSEDAKYVKSALNAIVSYLQQEIRFQNPNQVGAGTADIIFWLSDKNVENRILKALKKDGKLFKYGAGKTTNQFTFLPLSSNNQYIKFYKNIVSAKNSASVLWQDGFGNPLLTKTESHGLQTYTYYGRFNPQWTDWVWRDEFVNMISNIVYETNAKQFGFTKTPNKEIPENEPVSLFENSDFKINESTAQQSLANWIWALAFLVLLIERILTYRKNNLKTA